jgi:predicted N-formylglutamate amidohydrolase
MITDYYDLTVIVTAPHSVCYSRVNRDCDRRALEAARIIVDHFRSMALPANVHFYESTYPRARVDLNRIEGALTDWTQAFERDVRSAVASGRRVVLLDIHSFPDDSEHFRGIDGASPELTLLDVEPSPHAQLLANIKRAADFEHVHRFEASRVDYLLYRALELNAVDALLFEFNEDETKTPVQKINAVAHVLMTYLIKNFVK